MRNLPDSEQRNRYDNFPIAFATCQNPKYSRLVASESIFDIFGQYEWIGGDESCHGFCVALGRKTEGQSTSFLSRCWCCRHKFSYDFDSRNLSIHSLKLRA